MKFLAAKPSVQGKARTGPKGPDVDANVGPKGPDVDANVGPKGPVDANVGLRASPSPSGDTFIDECIAAHNVFRSRHQAPPLTHDAALSKSAQRWADQITSSGNFSHSSGRKNVGENIAMKWTSDSALMSGIGFHAFNGLPAASFIFIL